jgi:hypothetical protein
MSADPIGLAGGINVYAYGKLNPLRKSDTSGNNPEDEVCGVYDLEEMVCRPEECAPVSTINDAPAPTAGGPRIRVEPRRTRAPRPAPRPEPAPVAAPVAEETEADLLDETRDFIRNSPPNSEWDFFMAVEPELPPAVSLSPLPQSLRGFRTTFHDHSRWVGGWVKQLGESPRSWWVESAKLAEGL